MDWDDRQVIRNRLESRSYLVGGSLAGASLIFLAAILKELPVWVRVLFALMGVFYLYVMAYRGSRTGVYADSQGITVVSWFRSRRIPWSDIQTFSRQLQRGWNLRRGREEGFAVLQDGSHVGFPGISWSASLVEQLNERLRLSQVGRGDSQDPTPDSS